MKNEFGMTGDILLPRQGQELPTSLRVVQILFACGRGARGGWNNPRAEIGTHPQSLPRKGRESNIPSPAASFEREREQSCERSELRMRERE